jgi:alanine dehydrogenase
MQKIKLGVVKEGKIPPDKRVPLTPKQCVQLEEKFPNVSVVVQRSNIRSFKDEAYEAEGVTLADDLSDCDILIGVKEVNIEDLIPNKKYMFFSHTYKEQPYNRNLLQAIVDKKIQLIDYEILKYKNEQRIIGFGRYAGVVGCYNGLLAYGKKHKLFDLKPANECEDRVEFEEELKNVILPADTKIVATGFGRVGHGAREIFKLIGIKEVLPEDFLNKDYNEPVFTHLTVEHYYAEEDGSVFDKAAFYESGEGYISTFKRYLKKANLYVACHYWDSSSPIIISREDLKSPDIKTTMIADISCDIDGPIGSTIRPSTVAEPVYGYDPQTESEIDFYDEKAIGVMAVDNLPCELPKDASEDFGNELINKVFPYLFGDDPDHIIDRASETTLEGGLTEKYAYLESYLAETD